jgi:hypothetical protein
MIDSAVHAIPAFAFASAFALPLSAVLTTPSLANQTCTVIRASGKEYVGCVRNGYDYTLLKEVDGIKTFSAARENAHNPGCFDVRANGVIAVCTYRR